MANQDATDHPDVVMLPPFIVLIILAVAIALEWVIGLTFLPAISWSSWSVYVGVLVVAGGVALLVWAVRAFAAVGTNLSPHEPTLNLTTDGPYRLTRNPMYIGFMLLLAGISLLFSLEWGLILVPVLALVLHFGVVLREEKYLTAKFGKTYTDFTSRTRRWV